MGRSTLPTIGVVQGESWDKIYLVLSANPTYPTGDFSTWTATGQIWSKRVDKGGELLGEMEFSKIYDPETLKTFFYPTIVPAVSRALPISKYQGMEGTKASDSNCWIYDIEIEKDGAVVKLAPGYLYVIGEANRE